jgi:HEAT repeat protein
VRQLLLESTRDNTAFARSREAIRAMGPSAEAGLVARLAAKVTSERANAVTFLGLIKSEKSIPYILAKKRDPEIAVRIAAIEALWCFENAAHIRSLAESFLDDAHPSVRDTAVIVLGRYKDARATPYLIRALDDSDQLARTCARKGLESFSGLVVEGRTEAETNQAWKAWYEKRKKGT